MHVEEGQCLASERRYWVFMGLQYYPGGGMSDFAGSYSELSDAIAKADAQDRGCAWCHVYDTENDVVMYARDPE